MAIEGLESICTCPTDTELQSLVKVVNNFNKIFLAMASDYEGQVVSLIGRDGCGCTPAQIMAAFNANLIEFGRVYTGGGGGGAVDSVNGQTGVVVLDAVDVGAGGLADNNAFTGQNDFSKIPEIAWTSIAAGASQAAIINTQYFCTAFTSNITITGYTGTPENGTKIAYLLIGCNGTAVLNFPASQRVGDPTGSSTSITPTTGVHKIVFEYTNGNWYYTDTVVTLITSTRVPYGTSSGGLTSEAAFSYNETTNTLTVWAVSLGAGGETSVIGPLQTSDGKVLSNPLSVYASGTVYTLTASDALVDFGTTDPTKVIDSAGTYLLMGRAYVRYNGATYAANQTVTVHLRRTNNTAADITGATTTATMRIISTITDSVGVMQIPAVIYTTANNNDSISVYGSVSATPSVGSVEVSEASIVAIRLY